LRFTLEQANRSLPYVRRIVEDIVKVHQSAVDAKAAVQSADVDAKPALQARLDSTVDRLHELSEELELAGVELKDYTTGLVDFMSRHNDRDIYLCWRLGEERITHYHELSAGFAGRQPIDRLGSAK
jgi:hypothetical protein